MIEIRTLREIAGRYQTNLDNVIKEYFQHLFLAGLYREKNQRLPGPQQSQRFL